MWGLFIFHCIFDGYENYLLVEVCLRSVFIYLCFTVLLFFVSMGKYGVRQYHQNVEGKRVKETINYLYFFSLKQMGIQHDMLFKTIQLTGAGIALFFMIPCLFLIFVSARFYRMFNPWDVSTKTKFKIQEFSL